MKAFIPSLVMIGVGALLTLIAYSPTARFIIWKVNIPNLFLKRRPAEGDDLYQTIVPLILGFGAPYLVPKLKITLIDKEHQQARSGSQDARTLRFQMAGISILPT